MLILSKFHDYYDTAIGYGGIDKTVVYHRTRKIFVYKDNRWEERGDFIGFNSPTYYMRHIPATTYLNIGFCGKLYPIAAVWCYGSKDLEIFHDYEKFMDYYVSNYTNKSKNRDWPIKDAKKYGQQHFSNQNEKLTELFYKFNCPVFVHTEHPGLIRTTKQLEINPKLNSYGFAATKDAFSAHQEIYMFISGVLGNTSPEMIEISDEELAKKRGHGGAYSFRKPPSK